MVQRSSVSEGGVDHQYSRRGNINDQRNNDDYVCCIETPAVKRLKESSKSINNLFCGPSTDQEVIINDEAEFPSAVTPANSQTSTEVSFVSTTLTATLPMTCSAEISSLLWKEANYCCGAVSESVVTKKRSDYISWDDYFMAVATLSSHRSKDPHHPTGACIVDPSNRIIGTGYNGFPSGCSDDLLPWTLSTNTTNTSAVSTPWLHTPTPYMVHAEVNAILNKCSHDCNGARIYTPHFPCNECAKVIIQSRIAEVVYVQDFNCCNTVLGSSTNDSGINDMLRASRIMLTMAGVRMRQYQPKCQQLELNFDGALDVDERNRAIAQRSVKSGTHMVETAKREAFRDVESTNAILLWNEAKYDSVRKGSSKRNDYLSWDDYFMSMAFLTAQRSKDPNTQVGACIVDTNKRIVGLGYNGFPSGCSDDFLPWAREATSDLHKKYMYVCHAEVNAIMNKGSADVRGGTLYVALFPCNDCSKVIIQAGIREVVYMSDRYHNTDSCRASRILLQMAGVQLRNYIPSVPSISIDMSNVR